MKSIHEYLRQLLQRVPTSKMLQVPLCLDAPFEHFEQSANKPVKDVSQKVILHRPNSLMACSNIIEIAPDSLVR